MTYNVFGGMLNLAQSNSIQLHQQHVFDAHDVETHKSLHLSSHSSLCASPLIGELTYCVGKPSHRRVNDEPINHIPTHVKIDYHTP